MKLFLPHNLAAFVVLLFNSQKGLLHAKKTKLDKPQFFQKIKVNLFDLQLLTSVSLNYAEKKCQSIASPKVMLKVSRLHGYKSIIVVVYDPKYLNNYGW